jgi:hypothetical protein
MYEKIAAIVIRTVFNNQGWAGPCKNPLKEYRCFKCVEGKGLYINQRNPISEDERGFCKGQVMNDPKLGDLWCWEQTLCTKYFWRNVLGKWREAREGMPVYFVFSEHSKTLTLWGRSIINKVDNELDYPTIYFKPFEPLPENKWIKGLRGEDITGSSWRRLHYRHLDDRHESHLFSLTQGEGDFKAVKNSTLSEKDYLNLSVQLSRNMKEKLEKISSDEGRGIEEVIREALAKIIRDRGL